MIIHVLKQKAYNNIGQRNNYKADSYWLSAFNFAEWLKYENNKKSK